MVSIRCVNEVMAKQYELTGVGPIAEGCENAGPYLDLARRLRTMAAHAQLADWPRGPSGASELLQRRVTPFCLPRLFSWFLL
jgi:hypothetical protein